MNDACIARMHLPHIPPSYINPFTPSGFLVVKGPPHISRLDYLEGKYDWAEISTSAGQGLPVLKHEFPGPIDHMASAM